MKTKFTILLFTCATFIGCASDSTTALSTSHPAHADAKQAACCETSTKTLATHHAPAAPSTANAHDAHAGHNTAAKNDTAAKPVPYPLETCLVSGEKLGSMGKPMTFVHEGREIKLCCKSCEPQFKKETAKYLKIFDDAVKAKK